METPVAQPLRLVLRQADGRLVVTDRDEAEQPEIEFVGYAAHGRLSGHLRLDAARLTDMLNEHDTIHLEHVLATHLPRGHSRIIPLVEIGRSELFVVHAQGPRGDQARRTRTIARAISVRCGPYTVTGDVHTSPGIDPIQFFRRRRPMVPLTDAVIEYPGPWGVARETADTVIVNRDLVEWVRRAEGRAPTDLLQLRPSRPGT